MGLKPLSDRHKDKYVKVGLNIAYYRKERGITQLELAEKANISRSFMSAVEAPKMQVGLSFESFFDIAEALEIEPYKLLEFRK